MSSIEMALLPFKTDCLTNGWRRWEEKDNEKEAMAAGES